MNRKKFSLPAKYLLIILTIICLGTMFVTFALNVSVEPLKTAVGYVIVPMQSGINKVGSWFSNKSFEFQTLKEIQKENENLKTQIDELKITNSQLLQERYELDRLRELYQLDEKYSGYEKVAARVIGKDAGNWFNTFTIDKGSKDGLAVNMNVIAGSGLVGRVVETGANWAKVRTIIDDSSDVSAMILSTQDRCIVTGNLELMADNLIELQMLMDSDNNVVVGDQVVTSNISGKYLEGILIGYVTELKDDANKLTKSGYISPAVDFEHIQEVLVIKNLKGQEQKNEQEQDAQPQPEQ